MQSNVSGLKNPVKKSDSYTTGISLKIQKYQICNQRCYLLKCLKGLPSAQLNIVFRAIILSRILYALPAWGGFLPVELTNKIDIFHSIHQLLPPAKTLPMKLRSTHCVFALPQCNYNLYKSSFVLRNLFLDAY